MPLVPWSLGGWTLWTDRLPSPAWPCPGSVAGSNPQPLFAHPWKGNHRASTTAVTRVKGLSTDPVLSSEPAPGRYLTGADCWAHLNVRLLDGVASRSHPGTHPPVGIAAWVTGHGQCRFPLPGPPDTPAHPPRSRQLPLAASRRQDTPELGAQRSRACPAAQLCLRDPVLWVSARARVSQLGLETHLVRVTIERLGPLSVVPPSEWVRPSM